MSGGRGGNKEKSVREKGAGMQDLKPTVWIGKQGCTESTLQEIRVQIKKRKLIKVKWLKSTDVDPKAIAAETGSRLVEVRGRTLVLTAQKTPKK
jgi:RNA-binding protein